MKPSPLQLKWVTYPSARYELVEDFEGPPTYPVPTSVEASVRLSVEGTHHAFLKLSSVEQDSSQPYEFEVTVVAAWTFDLATAHQEYKPGSLERLPVMLAVNVARILYSGAREFLAILTARGTYGAVTLESVQLEPDDVHITSDESPAVILEKVFGVAGEDLQRIKEKIAAAAVDEPDSASTTSAKKKRKSKA